ncbi:hypothetical protein L6452_45700 [Arctium lappa]|nr:hypothetical protein L6452_45700 [Arctium lappa]
MCQGKPNLRRARPNPVNHRVFERKLRPKPFGRGHVCLGVTHRVAPEPRLPTWGCVSFGAETGLPCPWCGWPKKESPFDGRTASGGCQGLRIEAVRTQGKRSPMTPTCRLATTLRPRPQRMGAGDASRSDVERRRAGPPIDSGRGPVRIGAAAKARAVDMPVEMPSRRSWLAARAVTACLGTCVLPAPACGHPIRPVLKHGPRV